jgi:hypothetical protein
MFSTDVAGRIPSQADRSSSSLIQVTLVHHVLIGTGTSTSLTHGEEGGPIVSACLDV